MARTFKVEIVGDSSKLEPSFAKASRSASGFNRDIGKASRGALSASIGFHGLGRAVAFASSSFLGGAGIAFALKSTIEKAEESQRVLGQTANAVGRAGLSWRKYAAQVRAAALQQSKVSGFDDEKILSSFSVFIRGNKNVAKSLHEVELAQDVARGRNISLAAATQIVTKASIGMAGQLRRLGFIVAKNANGLQLLDFLQRKFAGSAERYGRTAAGAQDRFRVALENTQEAIGSAALPEITKLLNRGADWLSQTKTYRSSAAGAVGA